MTVPKALSEAGLLSTTQVAAHLNVHRSTVWVWIKSGLLQHERLGPSGNWIGVSRKQLDAFVSKYPVHVASATLTAKLARATRDESQAPGKPRKRKEKSK